jgi:hypothetical protein
MLWLPTLPRKEGKYCSKPKEWHVHERIILVHVLMAKADKRGKTNHMHGIRVMITLVELRFSVFSLFEKKSIVK